jgi:hypothetical protein
VDAPRCSPKEMIIDPGLEQARFRREYQDLVVELLAQRPEQALWHRAVAPGGPSR